MFIFQGWGPDLGLKAVCSVAFMFICQLVIVVVAIMPFVYYLLIIIYYYVKNLNTECWKWPFDVSFGCQGKYAAFSELVMVHWTKVIVVCV